MQQNGSEYIKKWIDPKFNTQGWLSDWRSCIPVKSGEIIHGYGPDDLQISQMSETFKGKTYYCKGKDAQKALEKWNHRWYQDVDGTYYIYDTKKSLWYFAKQILGEDGTILFLEI